MAEYIMIRHQVRDYGSWKTFFDAHGPKRTAAGLSDNLVLQGADDPNDVTIIFGVADRARAEAFAGSEDLRETMQRAGVVSKPDVRFLRD